MPPPLTVVGIGEVLWDLLPSGRQLGGAPANFAYCSHLLGHRAIVASRVGSDDLGKQIRTALLGLGMNSEYIQTDQAHATGTVRVMVDADGQPHFDIHYPTAWDFLEYTGQWHKLGQSAAAVCFGSLAQRSQVSRASIREFLDGARQGALRVFDVNLRQGFYSAEIISDSICRANLVKLNHEEVATIAQLLGIRAADHGQFAQALIQRFNVNLVCITRGRQGSFLSNSMEVDEHPGFHVEVKDTVGAGDAFTAGLVHEYLCGGSLAQINELANRLGAWVASCSGGMPKPPPDGVRNALEKLKRR